MERKEGEDVDPVSVESECEKRREGGKESRDDDDDDDDYRQLPLLLLLKTHVFLHGITFLSP